MGGVLGLWNAEAIHLLEAQEGAKYRSQFFHLFPPMKMHQLRGYGARRPPQGCPGVASGKASPPSRTGAIRYVARKPQIGEPPSNAVLDIGKQRS